MAVSPGPRPCFYYHFHAGWAQSDHAGAPYFDLYAAYFNDSLWLNNWIEVRMGSLRQSIEENVGLISASPANVAPACITPSCFGRFALFSLPPGLRSTASYLSTATHTRCPCSGLHDSLVWRNLHHAGWPDGRGHFCRRGCTLPGTRSHPECVFRHFR